MIRPVWVIVGTVVYVALIVALILLGGTGRVDA